MGYVDPNLIDKHSLNRLAYAAHESITEFFQSEENRREFEEWKRKRAEAKEKLQEC